MENSSVTDEFSITFEHRPGYLYAHVEGSRDSYEISRAYWNAVAEECARSNKRKVLLDEDLEAPIGSMNEVFHGAAERVYQGLSGVKIAFFDRHPEHHEQNTFGELVATNRGLFCRVFSNMDEAEAWLVSD
jgi:hypothetical protein